MRLLNAKTAWFTLSHSAVRHDSITEKQLPTEMGNCFQIDDIGPVLA